MVLANTWSSSLTYATMPFKIIALVTISSSLPPMSWFVNTDFYWNFVLLTYYCIDTLLFYCFKCISFHHFVANCYHMSCLWLLTLHVIPIGAVSIVFFTPHHMLRPPSHFSPMGGGMMQRHVTASRAPAATNVTRSTTIVTHINCYIKKDSKRRRAERTDGQ